MSSMQTLAWLFPVLFMLHDFEEIIVIASWQKKFVLELSAVKYGKAPFSDFISTESFSCAVAEEFFIFSLVSLICCLSNNFLAWYGLCFGFLLHFILHWTLCFRFRHYVPGLVTSVLFFPAGGYLLIQSAVWMRADPVALVWSAVLGAVAVFLNVKSLHQLMAVFEKWVQLLAETHR